MTNIVENIKNLKATLAGQTVLIAVSKGHGSEAAEAALKTGHRVFGENRVQEAFQKWPSLREKFEGVELHLIGPLQTNKAKVAVQLFDVIQTLDRLKLARVLAREIKAANRAPKLLVQVNTGEEAQKAGVSPADLEGFLQECKALELRVEGLMCIPPIGEEPALHFALLKKLAQKFDLKELSMGMSQDFETATALGATYVRVGTAIFGPRDF